MNTQQARARVAETFPQPFNKTKFLEFTRNLLNKFDESKAAQWNATYVKDAFKPHVARFERLGTYTSPDDEKLDVLIVHLTNESKLERARTAIRNFVADHLKQRDGKDAALVAFVSPTERQWRFSYVKMEYAAVETESGKVGVETRLTPARRYSYIVGEGESCHTAQTRFLALLQDTENYPKLAQLEEAFSVEAVTREFFNQYAALFGDIEAALQKLAAKDLVIGKEFKAKNVSTVDFAKKLMGQIVFLYFLQKKGWLGVANGQDWGTGPHDFLRRLVGQASGQSPGVNIFNDVLEPLFYDTLATDRGHEAWCNHFKCRIPFLNGGLFEPIGDYDWRKTDIILPNKLFTNTERNDAGDIGTGVLDVFDRYNFTVNEAEPLEKEVAIDPEMLGKVFENLIEENRRKGLGSFYTPREIVHYMCQESVINYLDTALNSQSEPIGSEKRKQALLGSEKAEQILLTAPTRRELVPRADLETFVHLGDQISHYEAVETRYAIKMPKSIEQHARLIDEKLADITVCDPAVGSGAFPVGMMTEIVRVRCALIPYFNDVHERTPYHFKRHAIQNCLYGVDIDPGAVEIAKLRLWLSLVVDEEDVKQIKPLPNLFYKIVTGNSLLGVEKNLFNRQLFRRLEELKPLYFDEPDKDKKDRYKQQIEETIHKLTNGKEAFDFEIYFSEVLHRKNGFDVVIANPPYGRLLSPSDEKLVGHRIPEFMATADVFVGFILHGISLLSAGRVLTYIVPTAWLGGPNYASLRGALLRKTINEIVVLPFDMFEAAYIDTLILQTQNKAAPQDHCTRTFTYPKRADLGDFKPGPWQNVRQADWEESADKKFLLTKAMLDLAAKFRTKCKRQVGDLVRMKRGVLFDHALLTSRKTGRNSHPYFEGDVYRYQLNYSAPSWVEFGSQMKERPQEFSWFENERILLRRLVSRKQRIMATLTHDTFITNKNLYSILPSGAAMSLRVALGLLNSTLMSRLYIEAVSQATKDDFPQVTITDLLRLPVPTEIPAKHSAELERLVDRILAAKQRDAEADTSALEREIDELVYALYDLTPEEKALVQAAAK